MAALVLRLLGAPSIVDDGALRPLPLDLRSALIGLLASHAEPVPRDKLAAVFWPDTYDSAARQNLRQLLHRTRDLLGATALAPTGDTVELTCDNDLRAFRDALARGDAVAVVKSALAPLLEGLERVPNAEWQAWLELERLRVGEMARRIVLDAAAAWAAEGPPPSALAALAGWVDRDPLDDDVHAAYLRCARHVPGEAGAAAARLARVTTFIEREIGGGLAEDVVLASTWLGERVTPARGPGTGTELREPAHRHGSPTGDLPLIGRERELAELDAAVWDETTRIVTVHGPGGIGKTRLVRAWAGAFEREQGPLPVVDLARASDPADAMRLVAQAHGWQAVDDRDADTLRERIGRGPSVIVLDEVDELPWLRPWLEALFAAATELTVVLTSRERVELAGEQVLRLTGLRLPARDDPATALTSDAVRLFVRAARRVRPDLALGNEDLTAVTRFARRVDGSPFALTVAAGWLQLGPPATSLDAVLDDPDDPLAIADVMEPSWQRLARSERGALAALSVFPEAFDVDAAIEVASCTRRTLLRLVDRSLVQPGTADGLALHALVRHHAARRLLDEPGAAGRTRARHARFVAARLGAQSRSFWSRAGQLQVHGTILAHLADLRQAWAWACEHDDAEVLDALADTVWSLEIRGWHALGAELGDAAIASLGRVADSEPGRGEMPLARALARRGIFAHRLGDVLGTRESAERARAIFERRGERVDPFAWFHLGIAAWLEGDLAAAEAWHRRLLAEAEAHGDAWAARAARANLGLLAQQQGDLDAAEGYARAALADARELDDGWGVTLTAGNLADVLSGSGSDDEVISLLELAIRYGDRFGMELAVLNASLRLGPLLMHTGRHAEAEAAYLRARELLDAGVCPMPAAGHGTSAGSVGGLVEAGLASSRDARS
jgi:DNA-binding SARP family transcriptional activator/tetratricopeptide (TPR) repeat protein